MWTMKTNKKPLVLSYLKHRQAIGALAFFMPVILALGALIVFGDPIQSSISAYYHTGMRNVFIGILFIVAMFLFCYKGWGTVDDIIANLSGLFALGIALLPVAAPEAENTITGYLHVASASLFFGTLSIFSCFLFVKSDMKPLPPEKKKRNIIFRICGGTMFACMIFIALYFLFLKKYWPGLEIIRPVFILETIALWAFGISWLVKGQAIFKDNLRNK